MLVAGLAVAALGVAAPVTAHVLLPASTSTVLDQDLVSPTGSLGNAVNDPSRRAAVVDEVSDAISETASDQGGPGAWALSAIERSSPGAVHTLVDRQLIGYANALQPSWDAYKSSGAAGGFGDYLSSRSSEVSDTLLGVSDRYAEAARTTGARVAYQVGRSSAAEDIPAALPEIGSILEKAAG
ncbi:hypothetical protein WCD74_00510 [Actinomycetospora sp. OC33-EN08]|uniref:Secreted protein n=1 Tax=Actinomycetospora aurantiaca TaxID=3129233 RepID=A0ABU8MFX5_9PSEU